MVDLGSLDDGPICLDHGATHDPARGIRCASCLAVDGVEHEGVVGVEVDPASGLCLYCQPCPECGQLGTACWDDGAQVVCYGKDG